MSGQTGTARFDVGPEPSPKGAAMTVTPAVWTVTIVVIIGLLAFDYFFHVRTAHTTRKPDSEHQRYSDIRF